MQLGQGLDRVDVPVDKRFMTGGMSASRWRKYGKDRVYVNDDTGAQVGWVDLLTGEEHLNDPARVDEFRAVVAPFLPASEDAPAAQPEEVTQRVSSAAAPVAPVAAAEKPVTQDAPPPAAPIPPAPEPSDVPVSGEPEWEDLSLRVPGQGVREEAEAALAAMRERSRVRTVLARALDVKTEERAWRVGADGEENVGKRLTKLTKDGWYVLHSVPVGVKSADIDHVVIGPGGVFTINTKMHSGKKVVVYERAIYVDGFKQDYLRNSRHEAERAGRLLTRQVGFPVEVRPVLVILTAILGSLVEVKHQPDGVTVLTGREVPKAFTRAKPVLTQDQVDAIFEQARRSTTWTQR